MTEDANAADHIAEKGRPRASRLRLNDDQITAQPGYIPSLDGLRALSVSIVVLAHHVNAKLFPGGLGVYIFFVISGFLITRLLLSEHKRSGRVSLPNFYTRRIIRLYPVILTYTATIVILYLISRKEIDWPQPISALFYFANYLYAYRELVPSHTEVMPFGIFWSLSVEEHFYLVFPLLLAGLQARPSRLMTAAGLVCALCLIWRLTALTIHPELATTQVIYMRSDFRADSIAYGVLLAATCESAWGRRAIDIIGHPAIWSTALLLLLGTLLYRNSFFRESLRYSIQGASIAILIAGILFQRWLELPQRFLNLPFVVWIGRLSYSIYVWHYLPRVVYGIIPGAHLIPRMAFNLTFTIVAAIASYYLIERPALWLRHYLGSRARAAPALV